MEQEIVRLYQQHCGRGAPPSACDALVEQLLPYWYTSGRSHDPSPVHVNSRAADDIEDLVKEAWKKFYNVKVSWWVYNVKLLLNNAPLTGVSGEETEM